MTGEEAKDELYRLLSDCVNGAYPLRNNAQKGRYRKAVGVAICSLEAWDAVKAEISRQIDSMDEIHDYRERKIGFMMLDIIDKYLQEVGNGSN